MPEPKYKITCGHCDQVFEAVEFLHFPLCPPCFLMGHRGHHASCWKCKQSRVPERDAESDQDNAGGLILPGKDIEMKEAKDLSFQSNELRPTSELKADWQPIETAPKDGTEILVGNGKRIWIDEWVRNGPDSFWLMCDQYSQFTPPTHWMKLPSLPNVPPRRW